ncbi:2'-5' RNA ligase family protein [Kribbella sp. NPDC004875]|uniref:2'-5' RNA ligase family protein n=1 Tax=Kribbella sp. NPDC004875 TaxID=3364107 RepID=UPI00367D9A09
MKDVRDHWYWRPNWRPGRSFYTWHIVFPEDTVLLELHTAYQRLVESLPGITPVPARWLHLTLQGVGFVDKVPTADLRPIVEAARQRLELFKPFEIRIGPAVVDVESLQLPVTPVDRMRRLRAQLRAAITDVWGPESVPALPELDPHISLGYWNQVAPAEPLIQRTRALGGGSRTTELTDVSLIVLNRDHEQYEWSTYATVPLGLPFYRSDDTGAG